jgi:hypothetical protein
MFVKQLDSIHNGLRDTQVLGRSEIDACSWHYEPSKQGDVCTRVDVLRSSGSGKVVPYVCPNSQHALSSSISPK